MIAKDSSGIDAALQRTKHALRSAGATKAVAHAIGTRRGWRHHRDPDRTLERWVRNVMQMLDGTDSRHWSLLDHLDAVAVLGWDPAGVSSVARAA